MELLNVKQQRFDISIFGERLRMLREEKHYSMDTFCNLYEKHTGQKINKSTLSRWENGIQEPMLSAVASISKFLGVSPLFILGESNNRNGVPDKQTSELLRIFEKLNVKNQTKILSLAYDLESEQEKNK